MGSNTSQKNISLLTFNTLGTPFFAPDITKRFMKISQLIKKGDYDIVCLQEIFTYYHLYLFKKHLNNFPFVIYQKNPFGPCGGLVIFSKIAVEPLEFISYSHPNQAYVPLYTKLAQLGILSVNIKPYSIILCTTHLSSDTVHNLTPKNKLYELIKTQSEEATSVVNRYAKKGISLILTGDFNIAKDSLLYKNFITNTNVTDVFYKKKGITYDPKRINYFYKADADICDYIFTNLKNGKIKILSIDYAFTEKEILINSKKSYLSDHIALHCTLSVNK